MRGKYLILVMLITASLFAQNKIMIEEKSGKPYLIGICNREAFSDSNFAWWFNSNYDQYQVDSSEVIELKKEINNYDITIVMGTWCSDSRREVPRFYKILDAIDYPTDKLTLINVDRKMKSIANEVDKMNIEYVPTIIIYRNEKEIGRIIETPEDILEKDLLLIIN
ncbi:MAG: thioredoxin family protein [Melioribacteraceae bacterium]|nr:thioredoxin family protein [Melioribacteraceae bacterium]